MIESKNSIKEPLRKALAEKNLVWVAKMLLPFQRRRSQNGPDRLRIYNLDYSYLK